METLSMSVPALLFSASSLLMIAFTNRFLSLAQLVRSLKDQYVKTRDRSIYGQIQNIRKRLYLIRSMQLTGIASLLLCVLSMSLLYVHLLLLAQIVFAVALFLMIISLVWSIREILISVHALEIHLNFIEIEEENKGKKT